MSKIAVGVRVRDGSNGPWATIKEIQGDRFKVDWDDGTIGAALWTESEWVFPVETGPVRTVTRREIVGGSYGKIEVVPHEPGVVLVGFTHPFDQHYISLNADELLAAAAVLTQLAEALREG